MSSRLRAELRPVLEAIEEMQHQAAEIRASADAKCKAIIEAADRNAADRIRQAEAAAPTARAMAAEQQWQAVEGEVSAALAAAKGEVARIETASSERCPELVEKIRACVLNGQELNT